MKKVGVGWASWRTKLLGGFEGRLVTLKISVDFKDLMQTS